MPNPHFGNTVILPFIEECPDILTVTHLYPSILNKYSKNTILFQVMTTTVNSEIGFYVSNGLSLMLA